MTSFERVQDVTRYPDGYRLPIVLRDGTGMTLRPIRPEDIGLLAAFHMTLSEQSVYLRYFTPVELSRRIDRSRLERVCRADHSREVVLVAEWIYPFAAYLPMILGVGRLTLSQSPTEEEAEFAIVVSDAWQGRGLGRALLEQMLLIGHERGVDRVLGYILPENHQMLHLCERLGFRLTYDSSESLLRATLRL